jgi:hypothetical protein
MINYATKINTEANNRQEFLYFLIKQNFENVKKINETLAFKKDNYEPTPFISIIYANGIKKHFEISFKEIQILRLAITRNNGYINLRSQKEGVKSLIRKGFIGLKFYEHYNDYDLALGKIMEAIFKQNKIISYPYLTCELVEQLNSENHDSDQKIMAISWYLPDFGISALDIASSQ